MGQKFLLWQRHCLKEALNLSITTLSRAQDVPVAWKCHGNKAPRLYFHLWMFVDTELYRWQAGWKKSVSCPEELRDDGFLSHLLEVNNIQLGCGKEKRKLKEVWGVKCILNISVSVWRPQEGVKCKQLGSARDKSVFDQLEWSLALGDHHIPLWTAENSWRGV